MRFLCSSLVLLLMALACYGQAFTLRRPYVWGAASGPFIPSRLSSLRYWWVYSDLPTTNVIVTNWIDRISSEPLSASIASERPLNTEAGMLFNGSDVLTNSPLSFEGGSMAVILKWENPDVTGSILAWCNQLAGGLRSCELASDSFAASYTSGARLFGRYGASEMRNMMGGGAGTVPTNEVIMISSSGAVNIYTNGVQSGTYNVGTAEKFDSVGGQEWGMASVEGFVGEILEVMLFTNALTDTDMTNLWWYATNTYALALNKPVFTSSPTNVNMVENQNTSLSVTVVGVPPITYRWATNGTQVADGGIVSGSTTTNLVLTEVPLSWSNYLVTCIATNSYGSSTSSAARLSVLSSGNDWANRVTTNGGAYPSAGSISALDTFATGLKSDGILANIKACCCFVSDNLTAAITPLIHTVGYPLWTNVNFVAGDLTTNGLTGDGSTKYLQTGVRPSAFTYTDVGIAVYGVTHYAGTVELGEQTGDGAYACIFCLTNAAGGTLVDLPSDTASQCRLVVPRSNAGFFHASRTANNSLVLYQGNSLDGFLPIGTNAVACSDRMTGNNTQFYAWGYNNNGSASFWSSNTLSFVAFTTGLTANQSSNLYVRVQALRTALGGGYQ